MALVLAFEEQYISSTRREYYITSQWCDKNVMKSHLSWPSLGNIYRRSQLIKRLRVSMILSQNLRSVILLNLCRQDGIIQRCDFEDNELALI
jgi:hypothetical protein